MRAYDVMRDRAVPDLIVAAFGGGGKKKGASIESYGWAADPKKLGDTYDYTHSWVAKQQAEEAERKAAEEGSQEG